MVFMWMPSPAWTIPVMMTSRDVTVGMASVTWLIPVTGSVWRIIVIVAVGRHGSTRRTSQGATDNGAVTATDLVADCRAGGTTQRTANCRINSRIISTCLNGRQQDCQNQIFDLHMIECSCKD